MKNKATRIFTMLLVVMLCMTAFSVTALAADVSSENTETATPSASSEPLNPDGTGTVIDNVITKDGREFFTITTPSKHVFYLIIDRQKNSENVYFLDAVTEKDLLALARSEGQDTDDSSSSKVTTTLEGSSSTAVSTPTASSDSQTETQNRGAAVAAVAVFAAVIIGFAVWFFKFRKPGKLSKGKPNPDEADDAEFEDDTSEAEDEPEASDEETEREDE